MTPNELALSRDLTLTRTALGNVMAAFQKAHIVVTHYPDLVLALAEARQVMGFPFAPQSDGGAES